MCELNKEMSWFGNFFNSASDQAKKVYGTASDEAAKVYSQAKKSVAEVTDKVAKPFPKPMLPGAAPEPVGKTTTGGKRHKSRRHRSKKRKTVRRRRA